MRTKTLAYIQIILGIFVALFPMYYIYTTYMNVEETEYIQYQNDMVKSLEASTKTVIEIRNQTLTDDGNLSRFHILASTIFTSHFLYYQISYLVIFTNLIVFLFGLNFIFNGLYKLSKN